MKHNRLLILLILTLFISVSVFLIYNNTYEDEFNYVALGDSIAAGRNSYGVEDYGYSDYISDYLKNKNMLSSYVNYAVSGYTVENVINDINYNKILEVDGEEIGLKKALRESNLVTISIGANDVLKHMNFSNLSSVLSNKNELINRIDTTLGKVKNLLKLVKQYAKGDIMVVGYYNPFPNLTKYKNVIDGVIDYADQKYEEICVSMDIYYVKVSDVIGSNHDYLPNPLDIHPNVRGYEAISEEIIQIIDENVLE